MLKVIVNKIEKQNNDNNFAETFRDCIRLPNCFVDVGERYKVMACLINIINSQSQEDFVSVNCPIQPTLFRHSIFICPEFALHPLYHCTTMNQPANLQNQKLGTYRLHRIKRALAK